MHLVLFGVLKIKKIQIMMLFGFFALASSLFFHVWRVLRGLDCLVYTYTSLSSMTFCASCSLGVCAALVGSTNQALRPLPLRCGWGVLLIPLMHSADERWQDHD